jgi:hypothetical protein
MCASVISWFDWRYYKATGLVRGEEHKARRISANSDAESLEMAATQPWRQEQSYEYSSEQLRK